MVQQLSLDIAPIPQSSETDRTEVSHLLRLAIDLGAIGVGGPLHTSEEQLIEVAASHPKTPEDEVIRVERAIREGHDPLGDRLCELRPATIRRSVGAYYTPHTIVARMVDWVLSTNPDRIADAGCGSGRFAAEVGRRRPDLKLIAIDIDPVATILTRAALAAVGTRQATVMQADYTDCSLPEFRGKTAFTGNPPYVRHHSLSAATKTRAAQLARSLGNDLSGLAGLHVHFFLATALHSNPGDIGCFITSSEWLDVGYGSCLRNLLSDGLGILSLDVIRPQSVVFSDALTTGLICCFEVGGKNQFVRCRVIDNPDALDQVGAGDCIEREVLSRSSRWSHVLAPSKFREQHKPPHTIPLGRLLRVHRGVVTGCNSYFVLTGERAAELDLLLWCRPAITSGKEILESGGLITNTSARRLLLDIPRHVNRTQYDSLNGYLMLGEKPANGSSPINSGYITSRRNPWWHIGASSPPIVVSYMARQPPVFALNPDGLAVLNIAHGLYPFKEMTEEQLSELVRYLNQNREMFSGRGRTYHGGLEKFEPSEVESLVIPARGPWMS